MEGVKREKMKVIREKEINLEQKELSLRKNLLRRKVSYCRMKNKNRGMVRKSGRRKGGESYCINVTPKPC
jgi:hypothetical protein